MSQIPEIISESTQFEDYSQFPIPRVYKINSPVKSLEPDYILQNDPFNPNLFQLFFSLVNFHQNPYELKQTQDFSPALETFCTSFDEEGETDEQKEVKKKEIELPGTTVMREHIVRKFLLECQDHFHKLTSDPCLTQLSVLHNELFYASEVLRHHKPDPSMMNFCDMLMAETLDLYNTTISKIINEKYYGAGKGAEELINELLKKEILTIRKLNRETFHLMSQCAIHRALEKAPQGQSAKIKAWAHENDITSDSSQI